MTFFYFVIISLSSFLYTAEEVTNSLNAMGLNDNTVGVDKFVSKNGHFLYRNTEGDVVIPKTFALTWDGDEVYEIQAAGNIVFRDGARIAYTGSGGGLILRAYYYGYDENFSAGTLIFEEGSQPIDFSASSNSAISIFYRPSANSGHKYANPTDFSSYIQIPEDPRARNSMYFEAFMLVENKPDLDQACSYSGCFALGKNIDIAESDNKKGEGFKGVLSFNSCSFNQSGWVDYNRFTSSMQKLYFGNSLYRVTIYSSPPYVDTNKILLDAAQTGNMLALGEQYIYDCRLISGSTRRNLIHIAAENGYLDFLKKAKENIDDFLSLAMTSDDSKCTALDLAAFGGHLESVAWFVGFLKDISYPVDDLKMQVQEHLSRLTLDLSQRYLANNGDIPYFEQQLTNITLRYTHIINYLNGLYDVPVTFGKYWLGYPIARVGFEEEYRYAQYTNQRFFVRGVGTTKTCNFLERFKEQYKQLSASSFGLEGIPARSRIILFANIGKKKIKKKQDTDRFENRKDKFPTRYRVQQDPAVTIAVENNPTDDQAGNVYLRDIPRYNPGEIPATVNQIISRFSYHGNQKIAVLMRQSRLLGMPITTEHLLEQGYEGIAPHADVEFLNKLSLLLDFEVSRRLPEQQIELPIGVSCARAFTLIEKGYLTWDQFLTKENPYHLFSDRDGEVKIIGRVKAIRAINDLFYQKITKRQKASEVAIQSWKDRRAYGQVIATAEEMHQELLEQYGGGYESEGDDYIA